MYSKMPCRTNSGWQTYTKPEEYNSDNEQDGNKRGKQHRTLTQNSLIILDNNFKHNQLETRESNWLVKNICEMMKLAFPAYAQQQRKKKLILNILQNAFESPKVLYSRECKIVDTHEIRKYTKVTTRRLAYKSFFLYTHIDIVQITARETK